MHEKFGFHSWSCRETFKQTNVVNSGWLRVCIEVRHLVDMKKKYTVMQ